MTGRGGAAMVQVPWQEENLCRGGALENAHEQQPGRGGACGKQAAIARPSPHLPASRYYQAALGGLDPVRGRRTGIGRPTAPKLLYRAVARELYTCCTHELYTCCTHLP